MGWLRQLFADAAMMKRYLKAVTPPIIWSGLKRIAGSEAPPSESDYIRDLQANLTDHLYYVDITRVEIDGSSYFVPKYAAHRPAARSILAGSMYEPATHALVAEIMRYRPGNLVHAGTFFGDMLPSFSRACPGNVFAFEPVLENYLLAKLCVDENSLANVLMFNSGLSDAISIARIMTKSNDGLHRGGSSTIAAIGQPTALLTIDCLGISELSLIQLDVEGYELNALRGAARSVEANAPIILVEDNQRNRATLLRSLGYTCCGNVPGLFLWVPARYERDMTKILTSI